MPDLQPVYDERSPDSFTTIDDGLFDELADLTADGREAYAAQGLLRR